MATQGNALRIEAAERRSGVRAVVSPGIAALVLVGSAWAAGLVLVLTHRVFVTNDSLSNYAHVWYVSDQLWHAHTLPLHMPLLAHGDAYAFPYGFVPWTTAALLRPVFGDWTVTLWLVLGLLGTVAATWWAFPELRTAWWQALLLANPMLVESVLLGQLPFLWAAAFVFAAIGAWRRGWWLAAAILLGAGQATHPAVILPIAGVLVLVRLYWEPRRLQLLGCYALSLLIAAPATLLAVASPVVGDSTRAELLGNFFGTVSLRAIVIGAPFIALALQRTPLARAPVLIMAVLIGLNIGLVPVRHNEYGWTALTRSPDTSLSSFVDSPSFSPGATYRLLRVGDGKVGMYQLIRAGATLDAEFFPESIGRRSWDDTEAYAAFLRGRNVDYVVIYDAYDARYRTNEHDLLRQMSADPTSAARAGGLCVQLVEHQPEYDVYVVSRCATVLADG